MEIIGSRAKVFHGNAHHTVGGLVKSDLIRNKRGRIVSRRKHRSAKKQNNLVKHGFRTRKGVYGTFICEKKDGRKRRTCKKM